MPPSARMRDHGEARPAQTWEWGTTRTNQRMGSGEGWGHILPWILLKAAIIQTGILYQHWYHGYSKDKKVHQEEPAHLRVNSDAKGAK